MFARCVALVVLFAAPAWVALDSAGMELSEPLGDDGTNPGTESLSDLSVCVGELGSRDGMLSLVRALGEEGTRDGMLSDLAGCAAAAGFAAPAAAFPAAAVLAVAAAAAGCVAAAWAVVARCCGAGCFFSVSSSLPEEGSSGGILSCDAGPSSDPACDISETAQMRQQSAHASTLP